MDDSAALFIILLIVGSPFLLVWALNTLFSLGIGYSLETWGAGFGLLALAFLAARN